MLPAISTHSLDDLTNPWLIGSLKLVELLGGTVRVTSAGHGAGTEVSVRLPRAPGASAPLP